MRRIRSVPAAASVAGLVVACASMAPLIDPAARAPDLPGFGTSSMTVSRATPQAQRWFQQGMAQAYAFNDPEAVRAFKAALAQDASCAMCAWGVAWQLGPNINATERGDLSQARRYAQLAEQLSASATPLERGLIAAMVTRYGDGREPVVDAPAAAEICGSGGTKPAHPLDVAYAERLRALAEAHAGAPDVVSLYAEAEMIATRGDWWDRVNGRAKGRIGEVADRLERVLALHPGHTGVNHYLIHAVDDRAVAQRAVASADRLGALAPASPHLVHMPSHTYVHVGRYADAEAVNVAAVEAQRVLDERVVAEGFKQTRNWNGHNRHFLWFAALAQGRGELALDNARKLASAADKYKGDWGAYMRGLPAFTLVRLGRWNEALEATANADDAQRWPGYFEYARAMALLRLGRPAEAQPLATELQRQLATARAAVKPGDDDTKGVADGFAVLNDQVQAELAFARGELQAALAAQQAAVAAADAAADYEPPKLAASARQDLGGLLLRAGRHAEAEAAYRADLARQPGNGWSLRGLQQALTAQGRRDDADRIRQDWQRSWRDADPSLRPT